MYFWTWLIFFALKFRSVIWINSASSARIVESIQVHSFVCGYAVIPVFCQKSIFPLNCILLVPYSRNVRISGFSLFFHWLYAYFLHCHSILIAVAELLAHVVSILFLLCCIISKLLSHLAAFLCHHKCYTLAWLKVIGVCRDKHRSQHTDASFTCFVNHKAHLRARTF